jgi:hypothetical protein
MGAASLRRLAINIRRAPLLRAYPKNLFHGLEKSRVGAFIGLWAPHPFATVSNDIVLILYHAIPL